MVNGPRDQGQRTPGAVATPTVLLSSIGADQDQAAAALLPLVYDELRRLAGAYMRAERVDHTLQPTALISEAYMRMIDGAGEEPRWNGRAHFLGVAARAMRRVLVDHARGHNAEKRGGPGAYGGGPRVWERLTLDEALADGADVGAQLVDLSDAMDRLAALDPRAARVVELRFFGGLTIQESATVLGVATSTVEDDWAVARAWLGKELSGRVKS